jgi:hypothetical protein
MSTTGHSRAKKPVVRRRRRYAARHADLAEEARALHERRERAELLATPVGAATAAKEAGQAFFEVHLEVAQHLGSAGFGSADGRRTTASSAQTLEAIERLGWRLENVGYYFMTTGETSTGKVFLSAEATVISGVAVGVYLFRSAEATAPVT